MREHSGVILVVLAVYFFVTGGATIGSFIDRGMWTTTVINWKVILFFILVLLCCRQYIKWLNKKRDNLR
jgi:hypothetical protein